MNNPTPHNPDSLSPEQIGTAGVNDSPPMGEAELRSALESSARQQLADGQVIADLKRQLAETQNALPHSEVARMNAERELEAAQHDAVEQAAVAQRMREALKLTLDRLNLKSGDQP